MRRGIAPVKCPVGDECKTVFQRVGESLMDARGFSHRWGENLPKPSVRSDLRPTRLFGKLAFGEKLPFSLQPVVRLIARQPDLAALFGDEVGAQRDVIGGETRRFRRERFCGALRRGDSFGRLRASGGLFFRSGWNRCRWLGRTFDRKWRFGGGGFFSHILRVCVRVGDALAPGNAPAPKWRNEERGETTFFPPRVNTEIRRFIFRPREGPPAMRPRGPPRDGGRRRWLRRAGFCRRNAD